MNKGVKGVLFQPLTPFICETRGAYSFSLMNPVR